MPFMRKWLFIILSLSCLFFVVDYIVSSGAFSYFRTRSHFYNLGTKEGSIDPVSKNKEAVRQKGADSSDVDPIVSINDSVARSDSSVSRTVEKSPVLKLPFVSHNSAESRAVSAKATVQSASAEAVAGETKPKVSFITGAPPILFFSLKFINEQVVDYNLQIKDISVGGLSALSYSEESNTFIALSDDKGNKAGPPRFYKLRLNKKEEGEKYELVFEDHVFLHNVEGQKMESIDPEGVAFFRSDQIFVSSEGAQLPRLLVPPAIFLFNFKGKKLSSWPTPQMYWPEDLSQLGKWGVKENKAFEALSIDYENDHLWVATESALHQDVQATENGEGTQYIRLSRFNIKEAAIMDQFIYPMDSRIEVNNLKGANGLTDFLYLGGEKLIVIERAYLKDNSVVGDRKTDANFVRLFLTDCSQASDVSQYQELKQGNFVTCGKRQLADLSALLGDNLDNIEGIAMGPKVSEDSYLLVLVSDNNFSPSQKTQFLYFHYILDK